MSQTKAQLIDAVDGSIVTADLADDAVNAAKLASNAVVNASVDASAAIAGSKINPSFTSNVTVTNTAPALVLVDSDHNSDFNIQASGGLLNFNDSTNSATRISITSDGKVNFGSVARVEVDGVFKAAHGSAATPAYNFLNDNDNGMFRATTNTIGFSTAGTERMRIDSSGHVLPATDSTYNIGADATRFANGYFDTLYGDGSNLTGIAGITIANNTNNRIITATGNANSINAETNLTFSGTSLIQSGNHVLKNAITDSSGLKISQEASNVSQIFNHYAGPMTFGVNNTEKMRIDSSGRVGIGHDTPGSFSSAAHTLVINTTTSNCGLTISTSEADQIGSIFFAEGASSTGDGRIRYEHANNAMAFSTADTERMRIDSAGKVGIGTSPDAGTKLHIHQTDASAGNNLKIENNYSSGGTTNLLIASRQGDAVSSNLQYIDSDTRINFGTSTGHDLSIMTNGTERVRVKSDGKVGIGTTSPSEQLSITSSGSGSQLQFRDSSTGTASSDGFRVGYNGSGGQMWNFENNYVRIATNNSERLRVASDGKVGIGITSPTATLHVAGDYRSSGRLGVGTSASTFANVVSYVTGTGSYPPSGGLVQANNDDSAAMFWNGSNSANYTGLSIECRTTGASYWMIANVYNSSFSGDLAFRTRTGGSTNGEKVRFRREGGVTFNGDTAAANALDDYEEGTFAPMTATQAEVYHARYTKIGNKVTINTCFEMKSGQSREHISLPFLPNNDNAGANNNLLSSVNNRYAGTCSFFDNGTSVVNLMLFHQGNQGSSAYFLAQTKDGAQQWTKSVTASEFGKIGVSFTYQTAA